MSNIITTISPTNDIATIERKVVENGGILSSFGWGWTIPERNFPDIIGEWRIYLTDTRGMGNHGSYVAVAQTPRTFALQKRATIALLRAMADNADPKAIRPDGSLDIATGELLPILGSPLFKGGKNFMFEDGKWAYFAHSNENFQNVGDGTFRVWVRPARK